MGANPETNSVPLAAQYKDEGALKLARVNDYLKKTYGRVATKQVRKVITAVIMSIVK
jgi:hypothetical protein